MDEYIDREALITKFKKMELGEHGLVERLFADGVYAVIAAFPAADVAPVVRCKDCKHSWEDIGGLCCSHGVCVDLTVPDDFYCAYGIRKKEPPEEGET